jgi:hypothetical protein
MIEPGKTRPNNLPLVLALSVTLVVALWPRLLGYSSLPLWLDEAWRANLMLDDKWFARLLEGSTFGGITSFAYATIVHGLHAIHGTEDAIRLSSLVPGVVAALIICAIVVLATRSVAIGLIAGIATSLSPWLISYAKELKPYSFELFIHLLLLLVALSYVDRIRAGRQSRLDAVAIFAVAQIAAVSAANIVLTLPGFYAATALWQYRIERRLSWWLIGSAACTAALILAQYVFIWRTVTADAGLMQFWSDSFYKPDGPRVVWVLGKLHEMLTTALTPMIHQTPAWVVDAHFKAIVAGAVVGLVGSFSIRNPERLFLFVSPILLAVVLNAAGMWPLGPVRVNMFLFGFLIVITFVGYGLACNWIRPLRHVLIPALLVWYGVYAFPSQTQAFRLMGPVHQDVPSVLRALADDVGPGCSAKQLVIGNNSIAHAVGYYRDHHAVLSRLFADRLESCIEIAYAGEISPDPATVEKTIVEGLQRNPVVRLIYSHLNEKEISELKELLTRHGAITMEHRFEGAGMLKITANR